MESKPNEVALARQKKITPRWKSIILFPFAILLISLPLLAQEENPPVKSSSLPNYFAQTFILPSDQKLSFKTTEIEGMVFLQTPAHERNAQYSVVTDFQGSAMRSRYIQGPANLEELQKWVRDNFKQRKYAGVEVKRLTVGDPGGATKNLYFVGHKSFDSFDRAKEEIEQIRGVVQAQGGNFDEMVQEAAAFLAPAPPPAPTPEEKAQFEKEEELMLKYFDHLDIGNELFGPFQGVASGERITWQSFAETSWRLTNLEHAAYKSQLGFWTNRVVFKGIKAPFNTVDPYVEATVAMDSTGVDFKSNAIFAAGIEWRPFARSAWLSNTRFWSLPLLTFIKNYRAYIEYQDRKNIKDEITGSKSHDWRAGFSIFYEWGIDLPIVTEGPPETIPDYIRRYFWGEYFGNYYFVHTKFNAEDDVNDYIFNSSLIFGFKLPGIPMPPNPINDEIIIMPYMRFEHVNSTRFSAFFENRYFVAAGARWMPFNNYRYKDNEWLSKTKIFIEYVGVGKVHYWKQCCQEPQAPDYDLRVGVNVSSNRR